MTRNLAIAGALVLAMAAGAAHAMDVDVHGSVSQGWLTTSEYDYLVPDSRNGSFEFNEMVLNFNSQVSDRLRVGVQFLGRDFGDMGNNEVVVDWALGDYRLHDALGLRFGKFKIPYGLYNKTRDIDFLRTSIMLPQGVYQEMFREVLSGCQGGSAYGSLPGGIGWSSFDYEVFAGSVDLNRTRFGATTMGKYIDGAMLQYVSVLNGGAPVAVDMENSHYAGTMDAVFGYGITYNTPVDGLRLNHTLLTTQLDLSATYENVGEGRIPTAFDMSTGAPIPTDMDLLPAVSLEADLDIDYVLTASAEYVRGAMSLVGEFMQAPVEFTPNVTTDFLPDHPALDPMEFSDDEIYKQYRRSWYGMASYRVSDLVELGGYYSWYTENWKDVDSDVSASYQKDIAATVRLDLSPGWTMKAEYHWIKGLADLSPSLHPEVFFSPAAAVNALEDSWTMFAVKTTYAF